MNAIIELQVLHPSQKRHRSILEVDISILRTCRQPSRLIDIIRKNHTNHIVIVPRLKLLVKCGLLETIKIPVKHSGSSLSYKPKTARGKLYVSNSRSEALLDLWCQLERTYYSLITSSQLKGETK